MKSNDKVASERQIKYKKVILKADGSFEELEEEDSGESKEDN